MALLGGATRILSSLLRDGDASGLLGDLREEYERRCNSEGCREAWRWYHREVYRSLAATLRMRVVEFVRSAPWGIAVLVHHSSCPEPESLERTSFIGSAM